jgi:hypothetical protein
MKRIFVTVGAVLLVSVPATMGLVGNTSFAQSVPVRVPSQATVVTGNSVDDNSMDDNGGLRAKPTVKATHRHATSTEATHRHGTSTEATHRHGTSTEASHQNGRHHSASSEAGDDKGGLRARPATEASHRSSDDTAHHARSSSVRGDSRSAKDDNGVHGGDHGGKGVDDRVSGHR